MGAAPALLAAGQTSLHGHDGPACTFRVVRGSAVETVLGSRDRVLSPGDVVRRASGWETTSVPDIAPQALAVARQILA